MKVKVNEGRCTAAGQCVFVAPELFAQRDDGIAYVIRQPLDGEESIAEEAIDVCPSVAIVVTDD
jgi:ferredoxin